MNKHLSKALKELRNPYGTKVTRVRAFKEYARYLDNKNQRSKQG